MLIKRKSPITGQENTMEIDVTATDILRIGTGGRHIRIVCPHLTEAEIVFYLTGKTAEEQNAERCS